MGRTGLYKGRSPASCAPPRGAVKAAADGGDGGSHRHEQQGQLLHQQRQMMLLLKQEQLRRVGTPFSQRPILQLQNMFS